MRYSEIVFEEIYGKFAKVYHRTQTHSNVEAIRADGFKSGPRAMYGTGIYTTYSLISQLTPYMVEQYGDFIIKSRINLDGFLILDYAVAKQVYGKHHRLIDQAKKFKGRADSFDIERYEEAIKEGDFTSTIAHSIIDRGMITGMRGVIYSGRRDGRCAVCYETDTILPISWTSVKLDDIAGIRNQKMVGVAEKNFAASLNWTKITNRLLISKAMKPSVERDLVTRPDSIRYIADPTPEQQLTAVNADPKTIKFIKHPTEDAQFAATSKDVDTIQYITDPAPQAILMPLLVMLDNKELLARLKPETILAALRMTCRILPGISRGNPDGKPTQAQWETAWNAPDANELISMYLPQDKQFDVATIPEDALGKLLHHHPAHLHYFKGAGPAVVKAAVLSPNNKFGNLALSNCAIDHIQVDCSYVPEAKLAELVEEQPFLIYAIKNVTTPLVALAMRKDHNLARDLSRNYDLPAELKVLVPKSLIIKASSNP